MVICSVEILEMIQIHGQHGQGSMMSPCALHHALDPFIKDPAIGYTGQRILTRALEKVFIVESPAQGFTENLQRVIDERDSFLGKSFSFLENQQET